VNKRNSLRFNSHFINSSIQMQIIIDSLNEHKRAKNMKN